MNEHQLYTFIDNIQDTNKTLIYINIATKSPDLVLSMEGSRTMKKNGYRFFKYFLKLKLTYMEELYI